MASVIKMTPHVKKIIESYIKYGSKVTCETFNIKKNSLERYLRFHRETIKNSKSEKNGNKKVKQKNITIKPKKNRKKEESNNVIGFGNDVDVDINLNYDDENVKKRILLNNIGEKYTIEELKNIERSHTIVKKHKSVNIEIPKNEIKFCAMGDTHMGSIYFDENWWDTALKVCEDENVDFICHVGDLVEGLSHRPGHVFELSHIGYDAQKKYACELLQRTKIPIYGIDGNHDRWYIKQNGALICQDIAKCVDNYTFLGHDEGDLFINNIHIKLWHGEDSGGSYALSYRIQKIIESFTGGEKPNVLLCGHSHKALFLPLERNVSSFSAGALTKQSKWMRGKRLANHAGFWIIKLKYNENGIYSCSGEFKPFYS